MWSGATRYDSNENGEGGEDEDGGRDWDVCQKVYYVYIYIEKVTI